MQSAQSRFLNLLAVAPGIVLLGCSPLVRPTPTRIITPAPATDTPIASVTPSPTATPASFLTPTRTTTVTAGTTRVKIFLIALDDNGKSGKKIGCGDSVVGVERVIPATSTPLTAALNELFSIRGRTYGQSGLYNSLYQSTLKVDGISIADGKATINLSGKVLLGGVCDDPRFDAQIRETALSFSTVKQAAIFINGIPIEKVISEKGGP